MTKAKKKMSKSTFAIIIMAVAMVAMLAFGGTFAYFTAEATQVTSTVTTGTVQLTSSRNEATVVATNAVDTQVVLAGVNYDPAGTTVDSWVIIHFAVTGTTASLTLESLFGSNFQNTAWQAVPDHEGYFYQEYDADQSASFKKEFLTNLTLNANPKYVQGGTKPEAMGATLTFTIDAKSIQKVGNETIATAWTNLFGPAD